MASGGAQQLNNTDNYWYDIWDNVEGHGNLRFSQFAEERHIRITWLFNLTVGEDIMLLKGFRFVFCEAGIRSK